MKSIITPSTLTILATYSCNASCENCCFGCNPSIKHRLSLSEIIGFIEEYQHYPNLTQVVFSGGECFLLGEDLNKAIGYCNSIGLGTRCVTNGYWAKSINTGMRKIRALKDAGINELNISTGDFHQKYVSIECVINAIYCGIKNELDNVVLVIESTKNRNFTKESLVSSAYFEEMLKGLTNNLKIIESPWMPMDYKEIIEQEDEIYLNSENVKFKSGCTSLFNNMIINPYGNIGICCGLSRELIPELNYARSEFVNLNSILENACNDFLKIWIYVDGPGKIIEWLASKNDKIQWQGKYAHKCHSCLAIFNDPTIRKTLLSHYEERVDDVLLRFSLAKQKMNMLVPQE